MWKVNRRRTPSDGKSSHCLWQGELKIRYVYFINPSPKNSTQLHLILTSVDNSIVVCALGDLADNICENCLNLPANHSLNKQMNSSVLVMYSYMNVIFIYLHCTFIFQRSLIFKQYEVTNLTSTVIW